MVDLSGPEIDGVEWKGYVRRALESIDKKLVRIDDKMDGLDECVNGMKVKMAMIGGTVSLVVTILVIVLKELIAK
ncbi:MAG: hypothetical protein M0R06_08650 [Sphaerochaeta sp.]|jgi:hypothetical protein|nr:hypothetical protein [Sphaerochaeta sp.]